MSNYKISRRTFIASTGAIFTLPLLESMFASQALAAAAADPRRYVMFYFPNGTYNRADKPIWATKVGKLGADNTSLALSPFANYYQDLISINFIKNDPWKSLNNGFNDEHQAAIAAYLTCADSIGSNTNSFEHVLAAKLGKPAFVLSGGATNADKPADRYVSYQNGKGNGGIYNPGDLYRSLLSKVVPTTKSVSTFALGNSKSDKSVLDSVKNDFNSFKGSLGRADQAKMDEYLTAVRTLEQRIGETSPTPVPGGATPTPTPAGTPVPGATPQPTPAPTPPPQTQPGGSACQKPTLDSKLDSSNSKDTALYLSKFYAFNDLIKIAFACDITRSVSVMVDTETSNRTFAKAPSHLIYQGADIAGGYSSHIAISHASGLNTKGYQLAVTRDRVLMQIVADLIDKLKSSNDPSGSRMLDNTVIQAGFGVQDGNHRDYNNRRPLILAGGKNFMTPGTSLDLGKNQMKDLYYTISTFLGADIGNFQGSSNLIKL